MAIQFPEIEGLHLNINHFERLSNEILIEIFNWLSDSYHSVMNLESTCKRFYNISQENNIWTRVANHIFCTCGPYTKEDCLEAINSFVYDAHKFLEESPSLLSVYSAREEIKSLSLQELDCKIEDYNSGEWLRSSDDNVNEVSIADQSVEFIVFAIKNCKSELPVDTCLLLYEDQLLNSFDQDNIQIDDCHARDECSFKNQYEDYWEWHVKLPCFDMVTCLYGSVNTKPYQKLVGELISYLTYNKKTIDLENILSVVMNSDWLFRPSDGYWIEKLLKILVRVGVGLPNCQNSHNTLTDISYNYAFSMVSESSVFTDVMIFLIKNGALPCNSNDSNNTLSAVLWRNGGGLFSIYCKKPSLFDLLIEHGAQPCTSANENNTLNCLFLNREFSRLQNLTKVDVLRSLISNGAKPCNNCDENHTLAIVIQQCCHVDYSNSDLSGLLDLFPVSDTVHIEPLAGSKSQNKHALLSDNDYITSVISVLLDAGAVMDSNTKQFILNRHKQFLSDYDFVSSSDEVSSTDSTSSDESEAFHAPIIRRRPRRDYVSSSDEDGEYPANRWTLKDQMNALANDIEGLD